MGLAIAKTGVDMLSWEYQNVSADIEGLVRLSSRNLLPDPGLRDFNPDNNKLRYWKLGAPLRPTGWGLYVRDRNNVKDYSRQNLAPIPLSDAVVDLKDELVPGPPPADPSRAIDIARPAILRTRVLQAARAGFPAGYYTIAFGWILGKDWRASTAVTPPGPRSEPFQLSAGDGVTFTMPTTEAPSGVYGILVYMTGPHNTPEAAQTGTLYRQERLPLKGLTQVRTLFGPLRQGLRATLKNDSYIGHPDELPPLRVWKVLSPYHHRRTIYVQLRYSLYTEAGISRPSRPQGWFSVPPGYCAIAFMPSRFHLAAIGWRPEVRFFVPKDDELPESQEGVSDWYEIVREKAAVGYYKKDVYATVIVAVPEKWYDDAPTHLKKLGKDPTEDRTGVEPPTEPLETPYPRRLPSSGLTPGPHWLRGSYFVGEEEGPPGPATRVQVGTGEYIRVFRPLFHNLLDNNYADERDLDDPEVARGWELNKPFPANSWCGFPERALVRYNDTTNATDNRWAFRTPFAVLEKDETRYILRVRARMEAYTSGKVRLELQEFDAAENLLQTRTIRTYQGQVGEEITQIRLSKRAADEDSPNCVKLLPSTKQVKVRCVGVGSTGKGPRNFRFSLLGWGVFEGWGTPRRVDRLQSDRNTLDEPEESAFPHGGYCIVVENPSDGPRYDDYTTLLHTGFENGIPSELEIVNGNSTANVVDVRKAAAINGEWGLRIQKTDSTASSSPKYLRYTAPAAYPSLAVKADINLNNTNVSKSLLRVMSTAGLVVGEVTLNQNGQLVATVRNASGSATTSTIGSGIERNEPFAVEISVKGAGSGSGRVEFRLGYGRMNWLKVYEVTGVNLSGHSVNRVEVGPGGAGSGEVWSFDVDGLHITREGLDSSTPMPGNYIEYYGPPNTPLSDQYGPTGLKVPLTPLRTYTFSCYVRAEDLTPQSRLFRLVIKDRNHNAVRTVGWVTPEMGGDIYEWRRFYVTFTAPSNAAYVEVENNRLGGGRLQVGAIQLELGSSPTRFTEAREPSGYVVVTFRTRSPGARRGDPSEYATSCLGYRDLQVAIADNEYTSYQVRARSGPTLDGPWSTWEQDIRRVPVDDFVQVRVDMSATREYESPELRSIALDIKRPVSVLCRKDGTEFNGGTIVRNIPGEHLDYGLTMEERADGRPSFTAYRSKPLRSLPGVEIEAYRASAVRQITRALGRDGALVIETPTHRYRVAPTEALTFETLPGSRLYTGGPDAEPFQVQRSGGVGFVVLAKDNVEDEEEE